MIVNNIQLDKLFAKAHQAKASRRTHVIITIITIKFGHTLLLVLPLNWMCRLSIIRKCVSFFNWNYCNNWNFEGGKAFVLPLMKLLCCSYVALIWNGSYMGFARDLVGTCLGPRIKGNGFIWVIWLICPPFVLVSFKKNFFALTLHPYIGRWYNLLKLKNLQRF